MNRSVKGKGIFLLAALVVVAIASWALWDAFSNPKNTKTGDFSAERGEVYSVGPFQVGVAIDPAQPRVGKNRLIIRLRDQQGEPVTDAKIHATAEMPAMGAMPAMQAPVSIAQEKPGLYTGSFELSMEGPWPLTIEIDSPSRGKSALRFDMTTGRKGLRCTTCPGEAAERAASAGLITVDAQRRQLIGLTTGKVERKPLILPLRAAGIVTYNETRLTDITLKFDAWIGRLYADYLGTSVKKGEPLFTVYSPQLISAQEEYLEILRRRKGRDNLLASVRRRLTLWDIGPAEIRALEKRREAAQHLSIRSPLSGTVIEKNIVEGGAVKAGERLLRIADLSQVWIEGQIYESELLSVHEGMAARVTLPDMPGRTFSAKVSYVYPFLEGKTRTLRVRLELPNPEGLLKPAMYATVHLEADLGERLVVPEGAVLYAGERRIVFVDLGEGRLAPRKIETGVRSEDYVEVLEGLEEGERIVTSGNFLIASESKLKAGIEQW